MSEEVPKEAMAYRLGSMTKDHRGAVVEIFNHYVESGFAAYPEEPVGEELFDRFREMSDGYPRLVAVDQAGSVAGFAFLHPYRAGSTFRRAAEVTTFLHPDHTRKGLGSLLLEQLVAHAKAQGIEILLANVSSLNKPSLRFHQKHGFTECGRLRRIAVKHNTPFDIVWLQRDL